MRATCFTPDGKNIVAGCDDGSIIVFVAKTGARSKEFKGKGTHSEPVIALSCPAIPSSGATPNHIANSYMLAAGHADGALTIYSLMTGKQLTKISTAHKDSVEAVAFSPQSSKPGQMLLLASASVDATACIWAVTNWQRRATLTHEGSVVALAWHPSKQIIYTSSNDRKVRYVLRTIFS